MAANKKIFTATELAKHTHKDSLYVAIHGKVYDCSGFIDEVTFCLHAESFVEKGNRVFFLKIHSESPRFGHLSHSARHMGNIHGFQHLPKGKVSECK
jgi:hypothetical protein